MPPGPRTRGREVELTPERTVEGSLGFVASTQRNLEHGVIGCLEQPRAELHAAAGDIGEWRLAKQPGKPLRENGA